MRELHARAQDLAPANSTFFAFLVLSTVIATTGLLLDSAATIIGAMVVAPLMGPAISASVGTILVGAALGWVFQAAVLVPPAATAGLGLAWGLPLVALAATVLVVVNLLAINISALVLFAVAGFEPIDLGQLRGSRRRLLARVVGIALGILVLSLVLGAVTWTSIQTETVKHEAQTAVEATFRDLSLEGSEVLLLDVDVAYTATDYVLGSEIRVDVVLGLPANASRPSGLAQSFDDALTERTGRPVVVRVGFIEEQVSERTAPTFDRRWPTLATTVAATASTTPSWRPLRYV